MSPTRGQMQNRRNDMIIRKTRKLMALLSRPTFAFAALRHRVAAGIEHLPVLRALQPKTLIDVGGNKGQFCLAAQAAVPGVHVIAFEPLAEEAERYQRACRPSVLHRVAISDVPGFADFHVTDRADSSSLLPAAKAQAEIFDVHPASTRRVVVRRLDDFVEVRNLPRPVLMKIDVQGAELGVLRGCRDLEAVDYLYVELSDVEFYQGQAMRDEVTAYLAGRGFEMIGVYNRTVRGGETLQADYLFTRAAAEAALSIAA